MTALRLIFVALGLLFFCGIGLSAGESSKRISATAFVVEPTGIIQIERTVAQRPSRTFSERHIQLAQILPLLPETNPEPSILMWTPAGQSFQIEVFANRNSDEQSNELLPSFISPIAPSVSCLSIGSLSSDSKLIDDNQYEYVVSIIYTEN